MSLITRTYSFTDGTTAYGSQVESEIANIVNIVNSCDQGNTAWTKVKTAQIIVTADQDFASYRLKNIGTPTTAGDAVAYGRTFDMGSTKITGLANGTASADAAAFGQVKYLQTVQATSQTVTSTSSATFVSTGLTATIVPTSASNRVKVTVTTTCESGGNQLIRYGLFRSGLGVGPSSNGFAQSETSATLDANICFCYIDSPATTSSTVYLVKILSVNGGSVTDNPSGLSAVIILEEIV